MASTHEAFARRGRGRETLEGGPRGACSTATATIILNVRS